MYKEKQPAGWSSRALKDGGSIPEIAFGTWTAGSGQTVVDQVEQAIEVGFDHIDTAQIYGNEQETGDAIHESGLARKNLFLTTKWSRKDNKEIRQSLDESLYKLGVKSLDLYLIHHPRLCRGDVVGHWKTMLELKREGVIKHAGVSNFGIEELEEIRKAGLEMPVVNQILLHPYVYARQAELLNYHEKHNIVTEAYSTLIPITHRAGGPLDKPVNEIAGHHNVPAAEIYFAWARQKGAVIVTTSHQKDRLKSYLHAGEIALSEEEIDKIDNAGRNSFYKHIFLNRLWLVLIGMIVFICLEYIRGRQAGLFNMNLT